MGTTKSIKFRFGGNADTIQSSSDLIYLESYCYFSDSSDVAEEARTLFDNGKDIYYINDFLIAKYNAQQAEKYKKQANLSKRFAKRTFENFNIENEMQKSAYEKALNYAQNIESNIESGTNIIFVGAGSYGTGKTHLACAIANNILEQGVPVKVLNVGAFVDELKEFSPAIKKELKTVKVLLIDDLGKENGTLWLCSEIYGIINARYENELPTIITTEGTLKDLENNYIVEINAKQVNRGASMISRLTESCHIIRMQGDDYRKKAGSKCK